MFVKRKKLQVIDGETLMDLRLEPTRFCVDTLLPQGVCMLSGAAKIGKSWMVLDWCIHIAKGEPCLESPHPSRLGALSCSGRPDGQNPRPAELAYR